MTQTKSDLEAAFDTQFHRLAPELPKPVAEYKFDSERKWRIDRAWPEHRIALEIEGGSHPRIIKCHNCEQVVRARTKDGGVGKPLMIPGAHGRSAFLPNLAKYNSLAVQGWLLLRFAHDDIIGNPFAMIDNIRKALELRGYSERDVEYLGPAEREALYLIAAGFSSAEAAERIGKTEAAVRRRVQSVCEKLSVRTRAAAVARAMTWKLLDPEKIPFPDGEIVPLEDA